MPIFHCSKYLEPECGSKGVRGMAKKGLYHFLNFFPWPKASDQKGPLALWKCYLLVFILSTGKIFFLLLGLSIFIKMAQLLNSILTVIKVFQKYAKENGKCTLLCKKELKQLLLAEFGDILQVRCIDFGPMKSSVNDSDTCIQGLMFFI